MRPNWPAIITIMLALVIIGWLLGRIVETEPTTSLTCPSVGQVSMVPVEDHIVVYCES